jgi:hypothetical protein
VIEAILASVGLVICVVLLIRMGLSPRLTRRCVLSVKRFVVACYQQPLARRNAARAAAEAIRRARTRSAGDGKDAPRWEGEREGNLYKPKSFKRPRKPH